MENKFSRGEVMPLVSLKDQLDKERNKQTVTDASQSSQINQLETRIQSLEYILSSNEIKKVFNEIDNLQSGESASIELSSFMNLTDKAVTIKEGTSVTIDLNGMSINAQTPKLDALIVNPGATAVINGNGFVTAANGGNGFTVIAKGKLIINDGMFVSGYDEQNKANACIYATGNGQVEIYGGRFETSNGDFVLNVKEKKKKTASIKAMGGEYVNFDPSNNKSEGPNTNFVPEGYTVEVFTEGENTIYRVVKA